MSKGRRILEADAVASPRRLSLLTDESSSSDEEQQRTDEEQQRTDEEKQRTDEEQQRTDEEKQRTDEEKPSTRDDAAAEPDKSERAGSAPPAPANTLWQTTNIHITGSSDFQIGNQYHIHADSFSSSSKTRQHMPRPPPPQPPPPPPPPPPPVQKLLSCREPATKGHLLSVKQDVGPSWRRVAKHLGLSEAAIQQLHHRYQHEGISEVFYRLLLKWKELKPPTLATVGILCQALWNSGETEAVTNLLKQHFQ